MKLLRHLKRDDRGTATIELALAAPILAMLIMGAVDVGGAFSRRLSLEQGAQRAVEKVMQTTQLKDVQGTIAEEVSEQANVDQGNVTVTFPRYCDARLMIDEERNETTGLSKGDECEDGETEAHYIQVDVTDDYFPMFTAVSLGPTQENGSYLLQAKAGMRTK